MLGVSRMKMKIGKKLFYYLLAKIKKQEKSKLKITLYKNKLYTKEGNHGEYINNHLAVALGEHRKRPDWYQNIATLMHEYAHHMHEKTRDAAYNEETYFATYMLYSPIATKKQRIKYGKITMLDEYQADSDAHKILKKFSANKLFNNWWEMANWYNLRIKFFVETGVLIEEISPPKDIVLTNKKYTKKDILKPVSKKHKRILWSLIESRKINFTAI